MIKNVALIGGEFVGKTSLFSYIINSQSGKYEKEKSSSQLSKTIDDFFGKRINDECLFLSTIFKNTTINFFDTKWNKNITLNLYNKLLHCDCAIFVIDIRNNTIADIYEQLTLLYILGIKQIVFAFNKIDLYSFSESKNRFMKQRKLILSLMKEIGMKKENKYFVPISSYSGENIRKVSGLKWYESYLQNTNVPNSKGSLLDFIVNFKNNSKCENKNTKALITRIYESKFPIFTGITINDFEKPEKLYLQPGNQQVEIKELQCDHEEKERVNIGGNLAFTLKNFQNTNTNCTALTSEKSIGFNKFVCKIQVKNIPKIKTNTDFILNFNTDCTLKKVFSILDKDEKNILKEHTSVVLQNQTAIVLIETQYPIYLEKFDKTLKTGRVILQNNLKEIVGFGIVKGIKV